MFHVSIYANDVALGPCTDLIKSTFDLDLHMSCIMDAQERREARLSRRGERERRNRALESAEEREARLARRRVRDRALRAAQSTAQQKRSSTMQKGARIPRRVYIHTYVCPRTYTFVWLHMRGHEQHPQTRSGSPHNASSILL